MTQLQLQLLRFSLCVYICIFIRVALIRPTVQVDLRPTLIRVRAIPSAINFFVRRRLDLRPTIAATVPRSTEPYLLRYFC